MVWKRTKYTIATEDGAGIVVSGRTYNALGVDRFSRQRDSLRRQRWPVSHLNAGLFVLYVNAKDAEAARRIADLKVNKVDWTGITRGRKLPKRFLGGSPGCSVSSTRSAAAR
jgi:hypothetical protein